MDKFELFGKDDSRAAKAAAHEVLCCVYRIESPCIALCTTYNSAYRVPVFFPLCLQLKGSLAVEFAGIHGLLAPMQCIVVRGAHASHAQQSHQCVTSSHVAG